MLLVCVCIVILCENNIINDVHTMPIPNAHQDIHIQTDAQHANIFRS